MGKKFYGAELNELFCKMKLWVIIFGDFKSSFLFL